MVTTRERARTAPLPLEDEEEREREAGEFREVDEEPTTNPTPAFPPGRRGPLGPPHRPPGTDGRPPLPEREDEE